eukprot:CAMPEP_0113373534 /NCGR_PEP_ID=MMETSP0013_2-20120614/1110_1 /TAXON_ID=2843 ORGANISM="Skeletonema costatum, Strain 1716" /NCGR_SAMPLE_ID=MMETSP0013_2 /ASSEMBLY_ACC=CAM_ASM_000158 /LENGTH=467 /DNA_ID=CAMNT_0000255481 /DNA_START=93 /DNA_END=1496 /DNA_ORIENTATION=+ /assembly_acc=CAM_ASM_000158
MNSSINPLFSLVEAAQLVGNHHQKAPITASVTEGQQVSSSTHEVSDDDQTIASKMIALRENHLMALRAAATNAGMNSTVPPQTAPLPAAGRRVTIAADDSSGGKEIFPMKLHALLADPAVHDVISWLPQGKSFVVLRPDVFAARVLPRYFAPEGSNSLNARPATGKNGSVKRAQGVHKYPSFTRKLNRWGFRQISRGPDAGAFCHDLFQRDSPELCRGMVCQKSRKSKQAIMERQSMNSDVSDLISLSSVSTKSTTASGEKINNCSAAITVSTAGVSTSSRSLPFKKRRSFQGIDGSMDGDIPSVVSHRNSSRRNAPFPTEAVPEMVAKRESGINGGIMAEAAAKEALARHFHEQHRAFAISSLMENSRLAMEAAGLKVSANQRTEAPSQVVVNRSVTTAKTDETNTSKQQTPILGATTNSAVFAPTVPHFSLEQKCSSHAAVLSSAAAAKDALMKAYMQALNGSST